MAVPQISPEQRAEALQAAIRARRERASLKAALKVGEITLAEALGKDIAAKVQVSQLLEALPGVGPVRAKQIMERLKIAENRRVGGLGSNQRAALEEEFGGATASV